MVQLIKPGLMFQAAPLPTTSTPEGCPRTNVTYVVCQDGSIQDMYEPNRPIEWELLEDENGWYYRVTRMNHEPKPLAVFFRGNADPVPAGRRAEEPQMAEIIEQNDDGHEEVVSVRAVEQA